MSGFEKFIKNHKGLKGKVSLTGYCPLSDMYWGSSESYEQYVAYEVWKHQQSEIDQLKAEKVGLEKKLKSVYDFEALFEIEKRCNGRLQDRIKEGIRIMDCNERYIPFLAMQSIKKALRGGHE